VGVNTTGRISDAPEGLRGRLVTIPDLTGQPLSRRRLLAAFIPRLLDLLAATDADPALLGRRYRPLCGLHGLHVQVFAGDRHHTGICRGIADDGGLILDGAEGPVIIHAGSLTRPGDEWRGGEA
jgi:biotin-(acetyl-CoA carboxylase) ligase